MYDGTGRKLRKSVSDNNISQYIQDYAQGIEYRTTPAKALTLESIVHSEGRVFNANVNAVATAEALRYEYTIKDHLGNARVTFTDKSGNGIVNVTNTAANEILQESHYYPFGMDMAYSWMNDANALDNLYKYNGKELNSDFGLNLSDYGARWYDASLGRFTAVDRFVDSFPRFSPYSYARNAPVNSIDINGDSVIVLSAPQGAGGYGHAAVLIGNEDDGWNYYSKNGTHDSSGSSGENNKGDDKGVYFESLSDFATNPESPQVKNGESEYKEAYMISTNSETDNKMKAGAVSELDKPYALLSSSCIDLVSSALKAGGLDPGTNSKTEWVGRDKDFEKTTVTISDIPNTRFDDIKKNNTGKYVTPQITHRQ